MLRNRGLSLFRRFIESRTGVGFSTPAALAGYLPLTVPIAQVLGLPVSLSFVGSADEEVEVLEAGLRLRAGHA